MATLQDLGVSAFINILSAFVFLLLFAVLRIQPVNDRVYFAKLYLAHKRQHDHTARSAVRRFVNLNICTYITFLSWVPGALRMSETELIAHAGLDSAVYLRIYTLGLKIFLPITTLALLVLIPVNVSGGTLLDLKKEVVFSDIDKLSISNVSPGSNRFFIHLLMAYVFTFWACFMLYKEYSNVAFMRLHFLASQKRCADQFTVIVRNIPRVSSHSTSETVDEFFRRNHPDHYLGQQHVYNANRYAKLVKQKERLQNWLDYYELKFERHPERRPIGRTGCLGFCGREVDQIDYYRARISELERRMASERQKVLNDPKAVMPVSFVTFDSRWGAAVCAQTQQSKNPTQWLTDWAPEPRDVYWQNLAIPFFSLSIRRFLISVAVFALVFFYMIPIAFVQSLANLEGLEKVAPFLKPVIEAKVVKSFLQGFLPGLALKIFLYVLPSVLLIMSKFEGYVSLSSLERRTASKYYYFMLVNVFLGSIIAGTAFEQLYSFLHQPPTQIPRTIGVAIPMKATFFMTYIMVDGWAGIANEIFRVKALVIYHLKNMFIVKTERDRERAMDPGSIGLGENLPSLQLYFLLGLVYAVVTPLLLPFIIVFFAFAFLVYRHQIINVYNQEYESAAAFWPQVHSRIIASLLISHVTLFGLMSTKKAAYSTPLLIFLPLLTIWFHKYCKSRFEPAFRKYPLEEAMAKDTMEHTSEPNLNLKSFLANAYLHPIFHPFEQAEKEEEMVEVRVDKAEKQRHRHEEDETQVRNSSQYREETHFCGYPERFIVNPDIPFVFSSSVAANVIKLHLIRIGVFALEGFIFHIHGDRQSAISNVSCMAASLGAGKDSKFQPMEALLAQQQPAQPIYFPDRKHGEQLDGSNVDMPACQLNSNLGDGSNSHPVKSTASLNAPPSCDTTFTATSQLSRPSLMKDVDNPAYSSPPTVAGAQTGCHLIDHATGQRTRPPFAGDASQRMNSAVPRRPAQQPAIFLRSKGTSVLKRCFKCLASDHLVAACRDPIKCSRCHRSGHKSFQCKNSSTMSAHSGNSSGYSEENPNTSSPTTAAMIATAANIIQSHIVSSTTSSDPPAPPPSPGAGSSTSVPARRTMVEAHVSDGEYEASKVYAYVYLEQAVHNPHLFIRQAMEQACGAPAFHLAASSRGVGIMVFGTQEEREQVVARSPINYEGNNIIVERHEDADNRFYAFYNIYAEVAAVDFPLEHWKEPLAREALGTIGNVCCIDPDCLLEVDFTSMRAVLRLDHDREVPEQLLVRNHSGPATIAKVYTIRTWVDANPMPDFSTYTFGPLPAIHTPPAYHPIGNPPTQMPAAPQNLVSTILEWEIPSNTPPLRPVNTRQATPFPSNKSTYFAEPAAHAASVLALPWYGIGGVPEREVSAQDMEAPAPLSMVEEEAVTALESLSLDVPPTFSTGGHTEEEHESRAQKRRARRKRAKDTARKLRRSSRLMAKEEPSFELPEDKAARVQQAKFDFSGASRRLRNAISRSYLLSDPYYLSGDDESLLEIAEACGASQEELASISGAAEAPANEE